MKSVRKQLMNTFATRETINRWNYNIWCYQIFLDTTVEVRWIIWFRITKSIAQQLKGE